MVFYSQGTFFTVVTQKDSRPESGLLSLEKIMHYSKATGLPAGQFLCFRAIPLGVGKFSRSLKPNSPGVETGGKHHWKNQVGSNVNKFLLDTS